MKPIGYVVIEHCEDFEKILGLRVDSTLPAGGILDWANGAKTMFPDRASARAAIIRTDHYRLAFAAILPERKLCKIERIESV